MLEFYVEAQKEDEYIWHTVGDGKVRSSHADRDGKTFSWDDPPEGGHPGEAYNCRCTAEDIVGTKKGCEELNRHIKAMEVNIENTKKRFTKAAEKFNAAHEAWTTKQEECKNAALSTVDNVGGGFIVGAVTGGWGGAFRGAGEGAATSADDVYDACINNGREKQAYEQAIQELESAEFWKNAHEEDLAAYRDECEQLGCEI